jgi:hypothetical protein
MKREIIKVDKYYLEKIFVYDLSCFSLLKLQVHFETYRGAVVVMIEW